MLSAFLNLKKINYKIIHLKISIDAGAHNWVTLLKDVGR